MKHRDRQQVLNASLIEAEWDDIHGAELDLIEVVAAHGSVALATEPAVPVAPNKNDNDRHV